MDMTRCGSCGAGAAWGARFCAACGQRFTGDDASAVESPAEVYTETLGPGGNLPPGAPSNQGAPAGPGMSPVPGVPVFASGPYGQPTYFAPGYPAPPYLAPGYFPPGYGRPPREPGAAMSVTAMSLGSFTLLAFLAGALFRTPVPYFLGMLTGLIGIGFSVAAFARRERRAGVALAVALAGLLLGVVSLYLR